MNNKMNYPKLEELETGSKIVTESIEYTVVKEYKFAVSDLASTIGLGFFGDNLIGVNGLKIIKILNPDGSTLWEREKEFPQDGDKYCRPDFQCHGNFTYDIYDSKNETCKEDKENNFCCKVPSEAIIKSEIMLDSIKKRWVPEYNEKHWMVFENGKVDYGVFKGDTIDFALIDMGNCFKTKQEAEANKPAVLRRFEFIKNNRKED